MPITWPLVRARQLQVTGTCSHAMSALEPWVTSSHTRIQMCTSSLCSQPALMLLWGRHAVDHLHITCPPSVSVTCPRHSTAAWQEVTDMQLLSHRSQIPVCCVQGLSWQACR